MPHYYHLSPEDELLAKDQGLTIHILLSRQIVFPVGIEVDSISKGQYT